MGNSHPWLKYSALGKLLSEGRAYKLSKQSPKKCREIFQELFNDFFYGEIQSAICTGESNAEVCINCCRWQCPDRHSHTRAHLRSLLNGSTCRPSQRSTLNQSLYIQDSRSSTKATSLSHLCNQLITNRR